MMAASLNKEIIFLILQFCDEENLKKTVHTLEQETGIIFNMKYFEDLVLSGSWEEVERYLSGFIGVRDNNYSIKTYFEIRKQKFLEALDKHDHAKALDILVKDLKVFAPSNEELYSEMTQLLTLDDFRKHSSLSSYGDVTSARKRMLNGLKAIIEANPLFHGKLKLPNISESRLRRLINQSLNWQHIRCKYPQPDPDIKTLFVDHQCSTPYHPHGQSNENSALPLKTTSELVSPFSGESISNTSTITQLIISDGAINVGSATNIDATLEGVEGSDNMSKTKSTGALDEVVSATTFPGQSHSSVVNVPDDLPKTVACILSLGSSPTSMDFHPIQQTSLLVGTSVGEIELWEVSSAKKLLSRKFRVWKSESISKTFLEDLVKDPHVSVNRILWSPNGSLFGVAYSKHFVHVYSYLSGINIQNQLEIDAHAGGVNDLAFSKPNKQLFIITCGDDKFIQVWDVTTGTKQYTFEGHGAPVYSLCPHVKERIHFLFSTSKNGEIKAWLYDNLGPRVAYDAPGNCCMRMAYGADGKRLFSCGTNKDGESCIVEWDQSEGYLMRSYLGLCKCSSGVVQFDSSKNQFLAAGDDHLIKVWDMDNVELLTTIDADGGLPATPYIQFNKEGTFLAVFANHNRIKILANDFGLQLLQTSEFTTSNAATILPEGLAKLVINPTPTAADARITDGDVPIVGCPVGNGDNDSLEEVEPGLPAEPNDILEVRNFTEIDEPSQCQSLRLPSEMKTNEISRLIYTNAGNAILALASNGIHLLWRWSKNETHLSGKATTKVAPRPWLPKSGFLMTNDLPSFNFENVSPCFALSKNDSYVVSASGGVVSLFNRMTFKKMKTFMPPPPAATCIAFYPQDNNIIAIGMDDSTILIYNARVDEVISKLWGHSKRVTGLAFSNVLNVLVSSGADAQIFVWDCIVWEKKNSMILHISIGWWLLAPSEIHVQFHRDQKHFLVVHESHLEIYETTRLQRVKEWTSGDFCARIFHATFSGDSQFIYGLLRDGTVLIFNASDLHIRCEINPTAYLPSDVSANVYPLVIAANPQEPYQFALGLTDGGVVVIDPLESEGKWGELPSVDDISVSSIPLVFPLGPSADAWSDK